MSERISNEPVIDRSKYPKRIIFVDREGYVCVADRPKKLDPAEKKERDNARRNAKAEIIEQRAAFRAKVREAKTKAKKTLLPEDAEAYEQAKKEYETLMGK